MIRRAPLVAAVLAVAVLLAGCAPDPVPSPTPAPPFASDAEAYAAAEATYRAYVDALNAVDLSDPRTFEPVYAWTTGDANASAKKTFSQMHADGWSVSGDSKVDLFTAREFVGDAVKADACVDVSAVSVTDKLGNSVVEADRGDVQNLTLTFTPSAGSETQLLISSITGREGGPACE